MQNTQSRPTEIPGKERMTDYAESALRQGEEKVRNVAADLEKRLKEGEKQVRQLASAADKQLHENPWPVVAGVAVSFLFLGIILGSRRGN